MILAAARKALPEEIERRIKALSNSAASAFKLDQNATIIWRDTEIAKLIKSEQLYAPRIDVFDSELLSTDQKQRIKDKLNTVLKEQVNEILGSLQRLRNIDEFQVQKKDEGKETKNTGVTKEKIIISGSSENFETTLIEKELPSSVIDETVISKKEETNTPKLDIATGTHSAEVSMSGIARGIMFQLYENLGVINRALIEDQLKVMPESDKPFLARAGIRIGTESIFMPDLLKPAAIKLRVLLYSIFTKEFPACGPPPEGRVSIDLVEGVADNYWLSAGYRSIGDKVMRVDMVERVAALVRTAARAGEFSISDEMLSLAGVNRQTMTAMIIDLGFEKQREDEAEDPEKPSKPIFTKKQKKFNRRFHSSRKDEILLKKQKQTGGENTKSQPNLANRKKKKIAVNQWKKNAKTPDINPDSPFSILANLKK